MVIAFTFLLYLYIFIIGACLGSFLNVVICRLPKGVSIAKGRSACPSCGHTLAAKDLVPVLSRLFLRGRCRYCGAPIAFRYTLVELLGGLFAAACLACFGLSWRALVVFVSLMLLMAVSFVDIDTLEIPNVFILLLAVPAVAAVFVFTEVTILERLIGFFAVSLPMFLLTLLIKDCFGGGDIKLVAVVGFLLGWKMALVALFISLVTGGAYGIYLLATKKAERDSHFAFGPFLSAGAAVALLVGSRILIWYIGLII